MTTYTRWENERCEIVLAKRPYGGCTLTLIDKEAQSSIVIDYQWGQEWKAERDAQFYATLTGSRETVSA